MIGAAILVPLAETLQAELGHVPARHPGCRLRHRHHRHHAAVARRAVLDRPRPLVSPEGPASHPRSRADRPPARRASAHAGAPLLKVENLSRAFGGLKAVSEVSFSVAEGEILGIIGPNGAGKTTLFNVLNGVLSADEGSAQLDGQQMLGRKTFEVCRMGVGRTFQVVRSFPASPCSTT